MSSHVVEAVARARYEAQATYGGVDRRIGSTRWATWDELPEPFKAELYDVERAAILALAENVSEEMVEAGIIAAVEANEPIFQRQKDADFEGAMSAKIALGDGRMIKAALQAALRSVSE